MNKGKISEKILKKIWLKTEIFLRLKKSILGSILKRPIFQNVLFVAICFYRDQKATLAQNLLVLVADMLGRVACFVLFVSLRIWN